MMRIFVRTLCALGLAGLGTSAFAVPIYFDFTGTVNSTAGYAAGEGPALGSTVSGGFNIETDRLYESSLPAFLSGRTWIDWYPVDPAEPLTLLNAGGDLSFPLLAANNYSMISFADGCTPADCPAGATDAFQLFAGSSDQADTTGYTGAFNVRSLLFESYGINADTFDLATVGPLDIASLPVGQAFGGILENSYDCVSGVCTSSGDRQFLFSIDSVTRGIGSREVAVPEPGTLGLFAAAGAALLLSRRRRLLQR